MRVERGKKFELRGKSGTFTQDTREPQGWYSSQGDQGISGKAFVTYELTHEGRAWRELHCRQRPRGPVRPFRTGESSIHSHQSNGHTHTKNKTSRRKFRALSCPCWERRAFTMGWMGPSMCASGHQPGRAGSHDVSVPAQNLLLPET